MFLFILSWVSTLFQILFLTLALGKDCVFPLFVNFYIAIVNNVSLDNPNGLQISLMDLAYVYVFT
jgi:hypothetical protein